MLGSHLSIAGGLVNALDEAQRLKMDCVQLFTKNQRQWKTKPLAEEERKVFHVRLRELGWHRKRGPAHVVSHNSYLINMASPDPEVWEKSVALQRIEIERCEELGIRYCVAHPGAHLGGARPPGEPLDLEAKPTRDERGGLRRIIKALDRIHRDLGGYRTLTCLETTAGAGSNLGYAFHHLAFIRDHVRQPERIGFCLDTCHVTAAGYDLSTDRRAAAVLHLFDTVCGLRSLRVLHLNDSVGALGSRKDRHAHIGRGECGMPCFRTIVNRRAFQGVPMILETPKGTDARGVSWDVVNARRLKRLIRRPASSR
jgi:deoxyribonuclease-4